LAALLESSLKNVFFYAIFDPSAALLCQQLGVGRSGDVTLGGNFDPSAGGGPLLLKNARVVALTDGVFQVSDSSFRCLKSQCLYFELLFSLQ